MTPRCGVLYADDPLSARTKGRAETTREAARGSDDRSGRGSHGGNGAPAAHWAMLAVVAAAIVAYLPALRNGFVWDDPLVLRQMRAMVAWSDLVVMPPEVPAYYYRPFIFVTYFIDRALGGETPFWFHLSVVLLHALNSVLVLRLALRLFGPDLPLATASAALFAVWPTHVESVAWMAGRSDVVVCALLLATALLQARRGSAWTAWAGGGTFFLALLSKEMAVAGFLLVPAFDWLQARRLFWRRYVPMAVAGGAYFLLRRASVGAVVGGQPAAADAADLAADLVRAIGFYLVRSVAPFGLSPYIPEVPASPALAVLGIAVPAAAAIVVWRRWPASRWPLSFLLLWFGATLAPSLVVIVRTSASAAIAERYLYVPSVASCALIAWGLRSAVRRVRPADGWYWATSAVLALILGLAATAYVPVWRDNRAFWETVARQLPDNAMAQRELGSALLAEQAIDQATAAFERALALPQDATGEAMTHSNLGLIYRRTGRFGESVEAIESALRLGPHPALYHNLGMTLMAKAEADQRAGDAAAVASDVRAARDALTRALASDAANPAVREHWDPEKTHVLLGQVLAALGDRPAARQQFEAALRLQPHGPIADSARRWLAKLP